MRIALVHRLLTRFGGLEKNVLLLARGLAARGHQVTAIVAEAREEPPPGVAVEVVKAKGWTLGGRYTAFDRAATEAVQVDPENPRAAVDRFDVVQGFDLTTCQDVLRVGRGVKKVYDRVLGPTRGVLDRLVRRISPSERKLAELEARVFSPRSWRVLVTNCQVVKDELVSAYGIDPDRIEVIWNGVDVGPFHPARAAAERAASRARFGFGPEDRVVLHVGTGYRRKGVDITIRAVARLPGVKLLVVGRDGAVRRYRRLARKLGIASRVVFAGSLPADAGLYGAGDVLSLPSRYEPFANTVLEALACGVPVVHPATCGASEVLAAEGLGDWILEKAEDEAALAEKLGAALEAGAWLKTRCRAAAERHTEASVVDAYEALYRRLPPARPARD